MAQGDTHDRSTIDVGITPDGAADFLRKLASDDEFRARFETDTRELLAEYGITVSDGDLPEDVVAPPRGLLLEAAAALGIGDFPYTPIAAGGGGGPNFPHTPVGTNAPHTFGPVPFAPFSFSYWVVFHVLHAASKR